MPTPAELLLALLGSEPLTRQERRLIARHLCRVVRKRGYLEQGMGRLAEPETKRQLNT